VSLLEGNLWIVEDFNNSTNAKKEKCFFYDLLIDLSFWLKRDGSLVRIPRDMGHNKFYGC
jgi:hypothetical protein